MCSIIRHRGPDEWGVWNRGAVGIGMRRLKVIDLESGHQPMTNSAKSLHIVFNGEIYNYQNLRDDLQSKGYQFNTSSDTETILYAYEEYGVDCVQHLRGMFAFAVWDSVKHQLFLARDRFGKKPLHYLHDDNKFVFGSEIKSILKHPGVVPEANRPAVGRYLGYGYVPDPETMFTGIKKLLPGHCMIWKNGQIKIKQYWDLNFKPDFPPEAATYYFEEAERLIRESVKIRMISDVPLGAFLSGGIDSSLVVAMMASQSSEPIKTFSIGFDEQEFNELKYARMVAKKYATDHHEEIVKPDAEKVIPEIISNFDEPFSDSSAIPTYYVSKLARRHVTVVLSGDGGDELFGGYDRYLDSRYAEIADQFPQWLVGPVLNFAAYLIPDRFRGGNTMRYLAVGPDRRYAAKMAGSRYRNQCLLHKDLLADLGKASLGSEVEECLSKNRALDIITRRQYADIKNYLVGDILTKVDRTSMLASLEARTPLLDHRLAEFAARLPLSLKVQNRSLKYLLKKIAEKYLPHELIYRPKMGFAVPINKWINSEWHDLSHDLVLSDKAKTRNIFNVRYVNRVFKEHHSGIRNHSGLIWSLMVLEMWYRRYIDG